MGSRGGDTTALGILKIKDSLKTIIKHRLHEKYNRIIFYILTRNQGSYSATGIKEICDKKLKFDVSKDILDYTDLATRAATAEPQRLKRAVDVLGAYQRGCEVGLADEDFDPPQEPPKTPITCTRSHGPERKRRGESFSAAFSDILRLVNGGGGGNRTRVRQFSAFGSTCLVHLLFNLSLAR